MDRMEEMKELIRREIQSIDSLHERVAFKELMEGVFLPLYEANQQMYGDLEKRVEDELAYDVNRYLIRTGVTERACYDASSDRMVPMEEDDLRLNSFQMADIVEGLEQNGSFTLMKVMLRCDFLKLQELWSGGVEFNGELTSDEEVWEIKVKLRQNTEYLKKIKHLYQLFLKNGIPWQTVNAPYLYKMADVVITGLPEGISGEEAIHQVRINFEDYNPYVCHDLIPVWNIQKLSLEGSGFPVPCEDHKHYEHAISLKERGMQHAYLAEDDDGIQSISQRREKLLIVSDSGAARKWEVYVIRNSEEGKINHDTYPVMQNQRVESFTEKYQRKWNQSIKTRAELTRFIKGFGLEEYVICQNCRILDELPETIGTYPMNSFIEDEIRDTRAQKKLILQFKQGTGEEWLQRDIASFIVSEVQRLYPEYECGGMMV